MSRKKAIFGVLLILFGLVLLGRTLDMFYFDIGDLFRIAIPLGFIVLGGWLIFRKRHQETLFATENLNAHVHTQTGEANASAAAGGGQPGSQYGDQAAFTHAPRADSDRVHYSKSFGDMRIDCTGVDLRSVEISSFIGDLHVNLAGGKLATGLNRMVISGFIGDIVILTPKGIEVRVHISSFVGDVEALGKVVSGFGNNIEAQTAGYTDAESHLFIAVNTFLGDTRIYNI